MNANCRIAVLCAAALAILAFSTCKCASAQDFNGDQGGFSGGNPQQGQSSSGWQKSNASPNFGGMLPGAGRNLGNGGGGLLQQLKQKFGSMSPAGIGQGMSGMPSAPGTGQGMPGMGLGMPGMGQAMPGMGQGMSGMGQGMPGMSQGLPGMGQGMPGMGQGLPGMGQGMSGMGQGMPGMGQGMAGMGQGLPGMGQGLPGMGQGMPGMGQGLGGGRAAALMQQLRQRQAAGGSAGGSFLQQMMQQRAGGMGGIAGRGTQRGSMIQQLQGGGGFGSFINGRGQGGGLTNRQTMATPMRSTAPSNGLPPADDSLFREWDAKHPANPATKPPTKKAPAKKSSAKAAGSGNTK